METVYVDILIITNFLIDYFILLLSNKLSGVDVKRWRIILGAFAASFSSLLIFAPELSLLAETGINLSVALVIVLIAFGFRNTKSFLKNTVIFFFANALIAGVSMAAWSLLAAKGIIVRNGAVFYNISSPFLVLLTAMSYVVITAVSKMIMRKKMKKECKISLYFENKSVTLNGFVDNGNMVRDVFSDTPVIICDYNRVKKLFSDEINRIFSKTNFEKEFYEDIINSKYNGRFRVIPIETVQSTAILPAIYLDKALLFYSTEEIKIDKIIMAVTHSKIAGGEFDVLVNPELIQI